VFAGFESVRSLLEAASPAVLATYDMTPHRAAIAGRYLGAAEGARFADERRSKPGVLIRLVPEEPRVWDLSSILPRFG
jgi:hypothetical protein